MKKAMIVNKIISSAKMQMRVLAERGFEIVSIALTNSEAMKVLESEKPDLLITSVSLQKEVDGLELANEVRAKFDCDLIIVEEQLNNVQMKKINDLLPCYYVSKPNCEKEIRNTLDLIYPPSLFANRSEKQLSAELI